MATNSGKPKQKAKVHKTSGHKAGTVKGFKKKKLSRGDAIALEMGCKS